MTEIKPGMFGLAKIKGKLGKAVGLGQNIVEGQSCEFTHAFLVVDNNQVIEAQPHGAILSPLEKYTSRPIEDVLFSDLPIQLALDATVAGWEERGFDEELISRVTGFMDVLIRRRIVLVAKSLLGVPYSYLDYLALGLEHFNITVPVVRDRVARQDRMICSQLVDWTYKQCGIHLFKDGRLPQDVTPGDLEWYIRDYHD
jgi:hypothetical protein